MLVAKRSYLSSLAIGSWLAALLWMGCGAKVTTFTPTQVMVRIEASSEVLSNLEALHVRIAASNDGQRWNGRGAAKYAAKSLNWPVDIPVTPSNEGDPIDLFEVVAEALDGKGDVLVQARAITGFVKGEQRLLVMRLEACGPGERGLGFVCEESEECHGKACQRCVAGECRATEVTDPNSLPVLDPSSPPSQRDGGDTDPERRDSGTRDASVVDGEVDIGDAGSDASIPVVPNQPVAPTSTGFATLGARRTNGKLTVYDDGFEKGPRLCTGNGLFCVTGGFEP